MASFVSYITNKLVNPDSSSFLTAAFNLTYDGADRSTVSVVATSSSVDEFVPGTTAPKSGVSVRLDKNLHTDDAHFDGGKGIRLYLSVEPSLFTSQTSTNEIKLHFWTFTAADVATKLLDSAGTPVHLTLVDVVRVNSIKNVYSADVSAEADGKYVVKYYPDHDPKVDVNGTTTNIKLATISLTGGRVAADDPYSVYIYEKDAEALGDGASFTLVPGEGDASVLTVFYDLGGATNGLSSRDESIKKDIEVIVTDTYRSVTVVLTIIPLSIPVFTLTVQESATTTEDGEYVFVKPTGVAKHVGAITSTNNGSLASLSLAAPLSDFLEIYDTSNVRFRASVSGPSADVAGRSEVYIRTYKVDVSKVSAVENGRTFTANAGVYHFVPVLPVEVDSVTVSNPVVNENGLSAVTATVNVKHGFGNCTASLTTSKKASELAEYDSNVDLSVAAVGGHVTESTSHKGYPYALTALHTVNPGGVNVTSAGAAVTTDEALSIPVGTLLTTRAILGGGHRFVVTAIEGVNLTIVPAGPDPVWMSQDEFVHILEDNYVIGSSTIVAFTFNLTLSAALADILVTGGTKFADFLFSGSVTNLGITDTKAETSGVHIYKDVYSPKTALHAAKPMLPVASSTLYLDRAMAAGTIVGSASDFLRGGYNDATRAFSIATASEIHSFVLSGTASNTGTQATFDFANISSSNADVSLVVNDVLDVVSGNNSWVVKVTDVQAAVVTIVPESPFTDITGILGFASVRGKHVTPTDAGFAPYNTGSLVVSGSSIKVATDPRKQDAVYNLIVTDTAVTPNVVKSEVLNVVWYDNFSVSAITPGLAVLFAEGSNPNTAGFLYPTVVDATTRAYVFNDGNAIQVPNASSVSAKLQRKLQADTAFADFTDANLEVIWKFTTAQTTKQAGYATLYFKNGANLDTVTYDYILHYSVTSKPFSENQLQSDGDTLDLSSATPADVVVEVPLVVENVIFSVNPSLVAWDATKHPVNFVPASLSASLIDYSPIDTYTPAYNTIVHNTNALPTNSLFQLSSNGNLLPKASNVEERFLLTIVNTTPGANAYGSDATLPSGIDYKTPKTTADANALKFFFKDAAQTPVSVIYFDDEFKIGSYNADFSVFTRTGPTLFDVTALSTATLPQATKTYALVFVHVLVNADGSFTKLSASSVKFGLLNMDVVSSVSIARHSVLSNQFPDSIRLAWGTTGVVFSAGSASWSTEEYAFALTAKSSIDSIDYVIASSTSATKTDIENALRALPSGAGLPERLINDTLGPTDAVFSYTNNTTWLTYTLWVQNKLVIDSAMTGLKLVASNGISVGSFRDVVKTQYQVLDIGVAPNLYRTGTYDDGTAFPAFKQAYYKTVTQKVQDGVIVSLGAPVKILYYDTIAA